MQLETLYYETGCGVFDVKRNPSTPMKDLAIENVGPEVMSVSGDRKRKYISNAGSNERDHSRNSPLRAQHRQRSEDGKDCDDSDQQTSTNFTKKQRGKKPSKTGKYDKICGDKQESTLYDLETSKRGQMLVKNCKDYGESNKNGSNSERFDENPYDETKCRLEIKDSELKKEASSSVDNVTDLLEEESTKSGVDKHDSNDIPGNESDKSSPIHELKEKDNHCDATHKSSKSHYSLGNSNNFSVDRICESASYDTPGAENNPKTEANHVGPAKPLSSLYHEKNLPVNNDDFESASITPVDDGCAATSKFTKFPNVASDSNIESECDTANEGNNQKDGQLDSQQTLTQTPAYKQEDYKHTNPTNWATNNRDSSYGSATEACCFRESESNTNLVGTIRQPEETKTSQLDLYTNSPREIYSVHLQPHQRHKENSAEEFNRENEMINSKIESSELAKTQAEQQIHQNDFGQYTFDYGWLEQVQETQKPIHNKNIVENEQSYIRTQSLQQQEQHHLVEAMPPMPHQHANLQDSLQGEHLMVYLHHQAAIAGAGHQSRLQQDIYQDLMMDDFHEDANPQTYKLRHLSPTTTKHENQDDGYETSAGDVLTPNSHSSSTHSGTPQLPVPLHVGTSALALQNTSTATNCNLNSTGQHQSQVQHTQATNVPESFNRNTDVSVLHDPYKFGGSSNACLTDKVERLFPLQSEQQSNLHNQNLSNQSLHGENLSSNIKADIDDIMGCKEADQSILRPPQKRRGRKKKVPIMEGMATIQSPNLINPPGIADGCRSTEGDGSTGIIKVKERKKHDRFNGMSEEEVVKRTLPDHLCHNLDIVIIGINPGLFAAYKGHHYAGPGNHFWKCLYLSGLTQEQMSADEDFKLLKCGIGFTNMVQRATKGSADLTRKEIKEGSRILLEKLQRFQPKIAVFNGKLIFEVFSGKKDFNFGRQPECVDGTNTYVWVMPSSSARCAQLPRAADKVPFYAALKKFRDYLNGLVPQIDEEECVFTEQRIREMCEQEQLKNLAQSHNSCSYNNLNDCRTNTTNPKNQSSHDYVAYSSNDNELNAGAVNVSESAIGGPGPPTIASHGSAYLGPQPFSGQQHPTPEKKKRGRPKKLRIQEIIDPNTGQKIQITNPQLQQPNVNNDFNNILNLSIMSAEVPKKKRGRPKKLKPLPMDMHSSGEASNNTVTHQQSNSSISLYNNPPSASVQQQLYGRSAASPNHSPGLNPPVGLNNGSVIPYTASNNTTTSQMTPPTNESSVDIATNNNKQNLDESTPPSSSPNICTVDFDPPNNSEHSSQVELHTQQLRPSLQQQRNRYEPPHIVNVDSGTNETFNQWMSPSHQFNYQTSLQQETQQQYQPDLHMSAQHPPQKQSHESLSQQQSPHSPWTTLHRSHHFEHNEGNHHHQQQQQQHYMSAMNTTSQHQQQQQHLQQQHQTVQHSTDVATKSLSGLESLVDQIPTIAESEAAAAAVESRLQTLQRGPTPGSFGDLQSESYEGNIMSDNQGTNGLTEATNDHIALSRNSSNGSNTPHYSVNSGPSCPSPINHYGIQRLAQASSPHTSYSGSISSSGNFQLNNSSAQHSPSVASDLLSNSHTPPRPTMANSSTTTTNSSTTTSHHLFSNFSVSHLAASSVTSCNSNNTNSSNKTNDWQSSGTRSPYHHPNLMAAAALQLHSAASTSPPTANSSHQIYIDPHTSIHHHPHHSHLPSPHQHHVQVNSLYTSAAQAAHTHHHPGMAVAYGAPPPTSQHPSHHVHNATADYGAYGASAAAAAAHMLHIPNPNYSPYGYSTAPPPVPTATTQNSYSTWNHHGHPSATAHHPHHLSMFERLKPSDIGSYSSF